MFLGLADCKVVMAEAEAACDAPSARTMVSSANKLFIPVPMLWVFMTTFLVFAYRGGETVAELWFACTASGPDEAQTQRFKGSRYAARPYSLIHRLSGP